MGKREEGMSTIIDGDFNARTEEEEEGIKTRKGGGGNRRRR